MKASNHFKSIIEDHLNNMASRDNLFAQKLNSPKKNLDDCIIYILNTVKNSGVNGFTDDEIFGMATHYYDEENVDPGKPIKCNVVVNHAIDLTEEEKKQARKLAMDKYVEQERQKMLRKTEKKTEPLTTTQQTLF